MRTGRRLRRGRASGVRWNFGRGSYGGRRRRAVEADRPDGDAAVLGTLLGFEGDALGVTALAVGQDRALGTARVFLLAGGTVLNLIDGREVGVGLAARDVVSRRRHAMVAAVRWAVVQGRDRALGLRSTAAPEDRALAERRCAVGSHIPATVAGEAVELRQWAGGGRGPVVADLLLWATGGGVVGRSAVRDGVFAPKGGVGGSDTGQAESNKKGNGMHGERKLVEYAKRMTGEKPRRGEDEFNHRTSLTQGGMKSNRND